MSSRKPRSRYGRGSNQYAKRAPSAAEPTSAGANDERLTRPVLGSSATKWHDMNMDDLWAHRSSALQETVVGFLGKSMKPADYQRCATVLGESRDAIVAKHPGPMGPLLVRAHEKLNMGAIQAVSEGQNSNGPDKLQKMYSDFLDNAFPEDQEPSADRLTSQMEAILEQEALECHGSRPSERESEEGRGSATPENIRWSALYHVISRGSASEEEKTEFSSLREKADERTLSFMNL